ncbi:MAG: hypothetical protein NT150_12710 [Bacteroidetes bacterium]|nr:hypothetical protein [Bacteroidota bacterium]
MKNAILILFILTFFRINTANAQTDDFGEKETPTHWNLSIGGFGNLQDDNLYGVSSRLAYDFTIKKQLLSVQLEGHHQLNIIQLFSQSNLEGYGLLNITMKKEFLKKSRFFRFSVQGGAGMIRGVKRGKYFGGGWFSSGSDGQIIFFNLNVPLQCELDLLMGRHFAMGIQSFCDLNIERPIAGGMLNFQFRY